MNYFETVSVITAPLDLELVLINTDQAEKHRTGQKPVELSNRSRICVMIRPGLYLACVSGERPSRPEAGS